MIVGSGLLARAFVERFAERPDVWVYAAGVSNSSCSDPKEYLRERARLEEALDRSAAAGAFVYFSTCSIDDPGAAASPYVRHKIEMEALVNMHAGHLIARLPQVAGNTPNPHTLLNYLYARISRSERFEAWKNASRNVVDVSDVEATLSYLIERASFRAVTFNVANPNSASVAEIVDAIAQVVDKPAIVNWKEAGSSYQIDVEAVLPVYRALQIPFGDTYLRNVITKYYAE